MKKHFILLFALLCASVMGWATINWEAVEYLGSTDPTISMNTYKYALDSDDTEAGPDGIANIQPAAETGILGLYTHYGSLNVVSCSHNGKISGTQLWVYVDQLTEKDTKITVTLSDESTRAFHLYNKNGGPVDPNAPHASGKGFGTYIAKNVPFYTRVDNEADETQTPLGTVDLHIITYGNKIMGKAKLNNAVTFQGAAYSMQFRIWNDGQTGFNEQWAQLREENTTVALIDMNSNYCNLNQGARTELPMNTYMETSAGTGAVPMFTYTLDYINSPIAGDETAPVISSAVASYSPITGEPTIVITATDANDMFYKIVDPNSNVSYSFSNTIQLTTDESNNVLTYTVYAIDYNGNVSSSANVDVQMKPALSNIALNKTVTAVINPSTTGRIVDGNFNGDRWSSAGAIHYDPVSHPDDYQDWFYINFVNIYDLSAVRIKWETARPDNYTFRTSVDGTNWTTVATYTEYPTANAIVDYVLPANTQGRFFGIWATSGYDNLNWGISPFEVEVYGAQAVIEDHNPPTLNSAALSGEPEWNQVRIAVEAEDSEDPEIYVYHVVDATNSIDQECMVSAGIITVTGLSGETTYNLSVKAVDGAGNESDAIVVNATTPIDTSVPLVAAPTPSGTNKDILPIYSDAFVSILAHPFDKDGWGGVPLMEEKNISGDHCLIYNVASANEVLWGMYDNGNNAIIATDGYHSATGMGIDASAMTYLHLDIWSLQACNNCINININDAALTTLRLSHAGAGWQSYDIALSEFQEGAEGKQIDNVRWMKFNGIGPISGKMALDNVYFWKAASGIKSVSATPNHSEMGTATVKQNNESVTEVTTGSTVTFNAVANEGYIFVNWSNGETRATFDAVVNANLNLTANFRAINHISCNEELTNGDYTVYVTYRKTTNENEYEFIVRSAQTMTGFSNTYIGHINDNNQFNLNGQGSLTGNGHQLSYTFTSTSEPKLNSPLYVNFANHGEVTFNQINNSTTFEFAFACADPEITAIALNKSVATLDMGNTLTLIPSFTPAYMSADIEWLTSDGEVATVSNGIVTPVAPGNVTITAQISESVKATCTVTVQAAQAHNWYGYGTSQDLDYTYRIEYTTDHHIVAHVKRQGEKTGLVAASMEINKNNVWTTINVTEGEEEGWEKGTTTLTYTAGDNVHILIQSASSGPLSKIEFDYEVGSDNVMPMIEPSTLTLSNASLSLSMEDADVQLTAEIHHRDAANQTLTWTSDNESVVTVVNGLVHPVGAGTTTIHATTHNDVSATCTVTVSASLAALTWYGVATFLVKGNPVGVKYSITRNADRTLTYRTYLSEIVADMVMQVNDGVKVDDTEFHHMTQSNENRDAEWTSTVTYWDGAAHEFFFYPAFDGGADRWDVSYTVGSYNTEPNMLLAFGDAQSNSTKITAHVDQTLDVQINRTILADNTWYTLCLPFDMSADKVNEVFGVSKIAELKNSEERGSLIHLNFDYVNKIEAGMPYLFKAGSDFAAGTTISGVTIKNVDPIETGDALMKFIGTYNQIVLDEPNQRFVADDNYLYSPAAGGTTMGAFRCYFTIPNGSSAGAPGRQAKIVFGQQTATGCENVAAPEKPSKIMINGTLYILRDGKTYTAEGLLVE